MKGGPVTIRGVEYSDIRAAAEALGVSTDAIRSARSRGRLDCVGIPAHITRVRAGALAAPVRVRGRVFADVHEAARHFKVSPTTVRGAICKGREDHVGRGRSRRHSKAHVGRPAHNRKPVKIGPHEWPSIRQCARALGLRETTLREHLKAGDADWLLARVMAWQAREEGHKPRELRLPHEIGQMTREKMEAARARAVAYQDKQQEGEAA